MDLGVLMQAVPGGDYVSAVKALPVLLVLLAWARLLTWIDKDAPAAHLPRIPINMGMIGVGIFAFILCFFLPDFWVALGSLVGVIAVEMGAYLVIRHQKVGLGDLSAQFSDFLKSRGAGKEKQGKAVAGQVQIVDRNNALVRAPDAETPERAVYDIVQSMLYEALLKGMERLELVPAESGFAVRYYVDGMPYSGQQLTRPAAAEAITFFKQTAGLDLNEKRKPQVGVFKTAMDNKRRELQVRTSGSSAGEQLYIVAEPKKRHELKLDQLGFTPDQLQVVEESVAQGQGIVLVAAPKGQGLTSTLYALVRRHDAFLSHIQTIEREPQDDLEGMKQNRLPATPSATEELKITEWVASQEPDVVLMSQLENPRSALELVKYAATGKRVYVGMLAGSAFEALSQWRRMIGDDNLAMQHLSMIICGRVVRRLCAACKVAYQPDPETLRKLNLDPQKISQLYQARSQPMRDNKGHEIPCQFCHDLYFQGRFGVYEVLVVDDEVRQAVISGGATNQLRAAYRKQRGRYLQEQALAVVETGVTSVQEVLRALRAGESSAASSSSAARPATSPPKAPARPAKS